MNIYIASDHVGFKLKEEIKNYLSQEGHNVVDTGNNHFDPEDDYTDFIFPCAESVARDQGSFGIVIGKSGNGESVAANKVNGIRATLCLNADMALLAREHNNANMLSIGADFVDIEGAKRILDVFLHTAFSTEERHKRRIEKILSYERNRH